MIQWLQEYYVEISDRKGILHGNAEALSEKPLYQKLLMLLKKWEEIQEEKLYRKSCYGFNQIRDEGVKESKKKINWC